ncbi:helix-turn-helix domain-containing protein [Kitasatospora sp. NBC_01560]|uniref:helix-turn-helix domain-containing protein n=1 Tax=Kitasatospora sp. NBC_01560 TaxID=2975965 RepID=UPI00386F4BC3
MPVLTLAPPSPGAVPAPSAAQQPAPPRGVPYAASIAGHRLGPLRISSIVAGPWPAAHGRNVVLCGREEHVTVVLPHHGTAALLLDGSRLPLRPGAFAVARAGRPVVLEVSEDFSGTAFHWLREAAGPTEDDLLELSGTAFGTDTGTAALVAAYLGRLARPVVSLDPQVATRLVTTAMDLLTVLAHEHRRREARPVPEEVRVTIARTKEYILRRLGDPGLTPEGIAAAHHFSVRYLHKLYQYEGVTVGRWIQRRRLEMCRRELGRPSARPATVAAVAGRWGFVSTSHFSRVFRAAYGVTPREWQAGAREPGTWPTVPGPAGPIGATRPETV